DRHHGLALALEGVSDADPEAVAAHFQGAQQPEKASRYYERAAAKAAEALAFDRAANLYELALEVQPAADPAERRPLARQPAPALAYAGRGKESAEEYLAAVEGEPDAGKARDLHRRAAEQYLRSGHMKEGLAELEVVLRDVGLKLPRRSRWTFASSLLRRVWV